MEAGNKHVVLWSLSRLQLVNAALFTFDRNYLLLQCGRVTALAGVPPPFCTFSTGDGLLGGCESRGLRQPFYGGGLSAPCSNN